MKKIFTTTPPIEQQIAALRSAVENLESFDARLEAAKTKLAAVEQQYGGDAIAEDPSEEAIKTVAESQAHVLLLSGSRKGAERRARELALRVVPHAYAVYRQTMKARADNLATAQMIARKELTPFFHPEEIGVAVQGHKLVVAAAKMAFTQPACRLGAEHAAELHQDIPPRRVVDELAGLETALAEAQAFAEELRRLG